MLDISDFSNIQVIALFGSEVDENSIPHNQIINGDYLYTAYYHDGLYVHDISDPYNPILMGYYDTYEPNDHDSYKGAWGVYPFLPSGNILISDMQTGLYVFDVNYDNPLSTKQDKLLKNSVFPNPCSTYLNISTASKNNEIELLDMQGKLVLSERFNTQKINFDVKKITAGIYFLKIMNEESISIHKVSVQ